MTKSTKQNRHKENELNKGFQVLLAILKETKIKSEKPKTDRSVRG